MPDMTKKQYIGKAEIDEEERTVVATINTDVVDRDKDVVLPRGASIEQYMKNPVMLWAHDYSGTPIGKTMWITKGRRFIKAKAKFATTPKAEEIYQLFKGGFLKAFSIGFIPKDSHPPTEKEIEKYPHWEGAKNIIDNWELLEFSAVPVPANPEALVGAVKAKSIELSAETIDELGLNEEETTWVVPDDTGTNTKVKIEPELKPEETESNIRIPVRSCDITATITISAKEGIKALYCGKIKKVATYLFAKAKGWTMAKAKAWVKEHGGKDVRQIFNCECIKCGHKIKTEKHCNEIKCPKCGGQMRREERPGPGRAIIEMTEPIKMRKPLEMNETIKMENTITRTMTRLSGKVY